MIHTRHIGIYSIPPYFKVGIAGAGGLGAMTALVLAKMGVKQMVVFDDDIVSDTNIPTQLHPVSDVGNYKVMSLQETLERFSDEIDFIGVPQRITPSLQWVAQTAFTKHKYDLFITAVDSITARQEIFQLMQEYNAGYEWFLDMRMGAEVYDHFLVTPRDAESFGKYAAMLASVNDSDVEDAPCTMKATFYTSATASGHAGKVLRDIVRDEARPHRLVHYIADEEIARYNI